MSTSELELDSSIGQKHRHPNSLANLRPAWQPGESPNPGGYPKNTPKVSVAYAKLLALDPAALESFQPSNVAEMIALERIREAGKRKGLRATVEITDRIEGKAPQRMELNSTTVNINVQVNLFLDAARDLADKHGVPLELAQARMLALADPAQRVALEAALAVAQATEEA